MAVNIGGALETLTLSKNDDQPWGFRIAGGPDFGTPLTVTKVTGGTVAEKAGMKVGDILLFANGQSLSDLTHCESYKFLHEVGNIIEFTVERNISIFPLTPSTVQTEAFNEVSEETEVVTDKETETEIPVQHEEIKPLLPPKEPSLFETIFGPLEEYPRENCKSAFDELVEELLRQQALETEFSEDYIEESEFAQNVFVQDSTATVNIIPDVIVQEAVVPQPLTTQINAVKGEQESQDDEAKKSQETTHENQVGSQTNDEECKGPSVQWEKEGDHHEKSVTETSENAMEIQADVTKEKLQTPAINEQKITPKNNKEKSAAKEKQLVQNNKEEFTKNNKEKLTRENKVKGVVKKNKEKLVSGNNKQNLESEACSKEKVISQNNKELTSENKEKSTSQNAREKSINENKKVKLANENNKQKPKENSKEKSVLQNNKEKLVPEKEEKPTLGSEEISIPKNEKDKSVLKNNKEKLADKNNTVKSALKNGKEKPVPENKEKSALKDNKVKQYQKNKQKPVTKNNTLQPNSDEELLLVKKQKSASRNSNTNSEPRNDKRKSESRNEVPETEDTEESPPENIKIDPRAEETEEPIAEETEEPIPEESLAEETDEEPVPDYTEGPLAEESEEQSLPEDKEEHAPKNDDPSPEEKSMPDNSKETERGHVKQKPHRKPFFPITPQPRPLVLPGGAMKFQMYPQEVYNDDFIAETLSGNAEVIMGTTIGINFMKYKKNFDFLKSSRVYQLIHEPEKKCPGSFTGRPEKLMAAEDYKSEEEPGSEV